ncbi:YveK family protein [Alkalibacterium sp. 20]|uniref:YveK family protein n=1 Tax=Alkalibacterium sp. 20 TaxID=1798803 RepID=UPI00090013F5|nr:Wzz/FepE/Etk N-terminal domain-containing protein [Alkalibacterium sp. 20]OJF94202.1 hypothetical protein AX762_07790 [Alkalibacterium sp. 20]
MKESIDFFKFVSIIRKKWIWIVLASLLGLLVSYGVTNYVLSPQYASVTRMIVSRNYVGEESVELGDIQTNIQLINTYRDIINDPVVLDEVIENLSFDISENKLRNNITIQINNDSQIFGISVLGDSPEQAAETTNLIAETFQQNVGTILNVENVSILSPARPDINPVSPRVLINIVFGTFLGFLSGIVISLTIYVKDKKVYDEETVSELLGWNNLGFITEINYKEFKSMQKEMPQEIPKEKIEKDSNKEESIQKKTAYKEDASRV